ncbi:MAG: cell division ATP-binding protein FtsE [Ruminococcaceae bacterium]|nr:cell division ATP-binding protein FtsE [Oscillospiraceae bacterium]
MIQFNNVSMVYDNGVKALDNISLNIEKGEFVFLVGSSAAGKSTMVRLMMREIVATEGEVIINGIDVGKLKRRKIPLFRRSIGVVFQDFRLLPNKTAYENVAYAMEIIGAKRKTIKETVPSVLELVGLSGKEKMYPNELSGGEQQRVALARAIVNSPDVLIADEPTGNLDPETSNEIMQIIDDINKCGTTVIMATHAEKIVDSMQKRVIEVNHGNIARDEMRGGYNYVL